VTLSMCDFEFQFKHCDCDSNFEFQVTEMGDASSISIVTHVSSLSLETHSPFVFQVFRPLPAIHDAEHTQWFWR